MKMIVDTRESRPLRFSIGNIITEVIREGLPVGDYWCEYENGSRPPVVFERKSLADLFGTLAGGYQRFKAEIERVKQRGWKLIIIIEEPLSAVYDGYTYSQMAGDSCVQKLFTLWLRHDVMPVFCNNRFESANYITEFYEAIGRNWRSHGASTGAEDGG